MMMIRDSGLLFRATQACIQQPIIQMMIMSYLFQYVVI